MTAKEIALSAKVKNEQTKEFAQTLAWIIHTGAALTGMAVHDPKRFPKLEDAFPSLFEKEEQQDWQLMKARMEAFATQHNRKFSEGL